MLRSSCNKVDQLDEEGGVHAKTEKVSNRSEAIHKQQKQFTEPIKHFGIAVLVIPYQSSPFGSNLKMVFSRMLNAENRILKNVLRVSIDVVSSDRLQAPNVLVFFIATLNGNSYASPLTTISIF